MGALLWELLCLNQRWACDLCTVDEFTPMPLFNGGKQKHTYCEQKSLQLTLKKSKNDTCLALGPYLLSSCLKKKKFVSAASNRSGFFLPIITSLSRSSRLSRPRQNALVIFSDQFGLPLAWTESISKETLKLNRYNEHYH